MHRHAALAERATRFAFDEEGAQVVEYALIIAVVSIALVLALGDNTTGLTSKTASFLTRIGTCFTSSTC